MALIEIELLKGPFEALVGLVARSHAVVPVPTLGPIGHDRLIRELSWVGDPVIVAVPTGFATPPGSLLLQANVTVRHVSVAELRANAAAPGATTSGQAWLMVRPGPSELSLTLVAFAAGGAPEIFAPGVALRGLPVPSPDGAGIVQAALVSDGTIVTLRLATSALDNLQAPLAGRVIASGGNWLIHLPPEFFCDMVLQPIREALAGMDDASIEEQPTAGWREQGGGRWGVHVAAGILKEDACPGLFGDVDVSVELSADAAFAANPAAGRIDIELILRTDASDWDSFRCWLGSGGIGSAVLNLLIPFSGVIAAIASLVYVSERVRRQVGEEAGGQSLPHLTQTGHTDDSATYEGSFPVRPLPFTIGDPVYDLGVHGLDVFGTLLAPPIAHAVTFVPDGGSLGGGWQQKVNCSHRSMDSRFEFQPVIISDKLPNDESLPVTVYLTSIAEPPAKCFVHLPNRARDVAVVVDGAGLQAGDTGFAVIHSSAGLRAYGLGPVGIRPAMDDATRRLLNIFCDSFHVPKRVIDIQELRWVEPPPDYGWGFAPLRQWQVVVTDITPEARIDFSALDHDRPLAMGRAVTRAGSRLAVEIVTDRGTDLIMRTVGTLEVSRFALTTRWLLPLARTPIQGEVTGLVRDGGDVLVQTADGWSRYDGVTGARKTQPLDGALHLRQIKRRGQTLKLAHGRVAIVQEGELVVAVPATALKRNKG